MKFGIRNGESGSGTILFVALFVTTRRFGPNVTRTLNGIAALLLLMFGVMQIWRGVTEDRGLPHAGAVAICDTELW